MFIQGSMMGSDITFATLGETVNFTFKAFGFLPRKEERYSDFDEKAKKSLQTLLSRLKKEEGKLDENFEKSIVVFNELLANYIHDECTRNIIKSVLNDLFVEYNGTISKEATYLSKLDSLQFFISVRALPQTLFSIYYSLLRFQSFKEVIRTDEYWFLPSVTQKGIITWPLTKVILGIYQDCGLSQRQFHLIDNHQDNQQIHQNYTKAVRWTQGRNLPALPTLLKIFDDSFNQLLLHGVVTPAFVNRAKIRLVLARVATAIGKSIIDSYGDKFLLELTREIICYSHNLKTEISELYSEFERVRRNHRYGVLQTQYLWDNNLKQWESALNKKNRAVFEYLQLHDISGSTFNVRPDIKEALIKKYGDYCVQINFDTREKLNKWKPSENFLICLTQGMNLKESRNASLSDINKFEKLIISHNQTAELSWLHSWLKGIFFYRNKNFDESYEYIEKAYLSGRYTAGSYQFDLVNQYVELSAKTNRWNEFRQGVHWAKYVGLEIRFIRDKEPTEDNLKYALEILKVTNYHI